MTDLHNLQSGAGIPVIKPLYGMNLELDNLLSNIKNTLKDNTEKEKLKKQVCPPTGGGPRHSPAASNQAEEAQVAADAQVEAQVVVHPKNQAEESCNRYTNIINKLEEVVKTYFSNDEMNNLMEQYEAKYRIAKANVEEEQRKLTTALAADKKEKKDKLRQRLKKKAAGQSAGSLKRKTKKKKKHRKSKKSKKMRRRRRKTRKRRKSRKAKKSRRRRRRRK